MAKRIKTELHFEIKALRFGLVSDKHVAILRGFVKNNKINLNFELTIEPIEDGQWRSVTFGYLTKSRPPDTFNSIELIKELVNRSSRLLDTINMWPSEQTQSGARLCINQRVIPEEVTHKVPISFRPDLLNLEGMEWKYLWEHIERRVESDPFFEVLGFDKNTVQRVLPFLQNLFSHSWVKSKFRQAGFSRMGESIEPEHQGWFPAYHLARTANGSVCRDPGWNYLIEIGLAIETLSNFEGIERLRGQLVRSSGTQHHICMAAELLEKGFLLGLEPLVGAGSATNDLLVKSKDQIFQVEVKEFSSKNPGKRLEKEILAKSKKVPKTPDLPIVFHAVLLEAGVFDKEHEDKFVAAVQNIKDSLPENISAVIAGKRFVDSFGGRIKRDIECIVLNDSAVNPITEDDLAVAFSANFSSVEYPVYGIGSFFVYGNRK